MLPLRNPRLDNPVKRLPTTFIDAADAARLRELARANGIPFNEALRQVLALYFDQPFSLNTGRVRLPQLNAPANIVRGVDALSEELGVPRGEVLRKIVGETLRKHGD